MTMYVSIRRINCMCVCLIVFNVAYRAVNHFDNTLWTIWAV